MQVGMSAPECTVCKGQTQLTTTGECKCPPEHFLQEGECKHCPPNCGKCNLSIGADEPVCEECLQGYTKNTTTFMCENEGTGCPDGSFKPTDS